MITYKELIQQHDWRPNKALGQNFLHSIDQARRIVSKAGIGPETSVFEIGPGSGVLTQALWEKAKQVVTLEIDRQLFELLSRQMVAKNLHWILGDALKFDFAELAQFADPAGENKSDAGFRWHAISNLPYVTGVEILFRLLPRNDLFGRVSLMFQKEVAVRLLAAAGSRDYGSLSVTSAYFAGVKKLLGIKATNFLPQPKVDSVILQFSLKEKRDFSGEMEKGYLEFVRQIFHYRRKQLGNVLRTEKNFAFPMERLLETFKALEIDLKRRPETLSAQELVQIYTHLSK